MNKICTILALIPVTVQLVGCAGWQSRQSSESPSARVAHPPVTQADLPKVPLTQALLYDLMVGEIAGQRGKFAMSVDHYVRAAQATRDPRVAERATRIATYGRRHDAALVAAKIWVETDAENLKARQILAALYIRNHQPDAALEHLEKLLAGSGDDTAKQLLLISNQLSGEQDKQAALNVMRTLLNTRKDNPDALYAFANLAVHVGETDEAMQAIDKALEQRPEWAAAMILRARVLTREGNQPAAIKYLSQGVSELPDNNTLRLAYARLLVEAQRLDDGWKQFGVLHERVPDNNDILYALAVLSMQTKRLEVAEGQFLKLSDVPGRADEANFSLGQIAELRKDQEQAVDYYAAIRPGKHYLDAQIRIAYLLVDFKGVDDALTHLRAIDTHRPVDRVRLYITEGDILTDADQQDKAMALYNRVLKTSPDNYDLLYARAMLAEKMGDLDRLEKDLRRVLKLNPDNAQALNALGYTLADRTGRLKEALGYIQRALELEPRSFYILDSMGWVLYRMGKYEEAVKYLRQAIDVRWDPEIAAHLGEVLWVKGDQSEARELWESALKKSPGDKNLLNVIKRFEQ